ncbi:pilus assembly protein [Devosia sp. J2-20]|jgi:Flp pilus assembly protein TadG|uniref:Pilus assembly protein n=1 Tax=Devosia litorisediminis TaxID=2829817 RepID=A0A942I7A5_9HYPH|nr:MULTISPECIES: TadE/TadG family type IV pilus assembly protein [Devosia]MBS3849923.1 pilus assembly protein [Devosia litorisediminis]MCZ4346923.1 pilus assembly protein [Devosia neptuniae]WDR00646.1 pilus assembly protein [Devosia sp. J2-20]|tara:strand:- start:1392 stop:1961 length:570 start_codon:yes stop_codon:yes gene_type:complete|eukprot:GHVR01144564.1.p1 GENE.GHVR01144564.1~~GHVR01144564.1.p1  ORF type:complete len:190 (-),score=7.61 GHVR01144564.1:137-706(-)
MATLLGRLIRRVCRRKAGAALLRNERGTTAVEFALLGLPFFMIIGAILETSVVFLSSQVLESAVQDTSRLIRTGRSQGTITTAAEFKTKVCDRLFGLYGDCSGLHVEVSTINDFASAAISPPVDWTCEVDCTWSRPETYVAGKGSSIVVVQVYYKWPILLSLGEMSLANLPGQKRLLATSTVFRSEPYS